jgi:hypothetical protein
MTLFPGPAVQQYELSRNDGLAADFEAGAAGGLIDHVARNDGLFRIDDDRGRPGHQAAWWDPYESAIFAHCPARAGNRPEIITGTR